MGVNGGSVATISGAGEMSGFRDVSGVDVYSSLTGADECATEGANKGSCCDRVMHLYIYIFYTYTVKFNNKYYHR